MKTIFLILSATFFVGIFCVSCEKEVVTTENNQIEDFSLKAQEWGIHRKFFPNGGDPYCEEPKENCFDDLIVRPEKQNYNSFKTFLTKENEDISNFFKTDEYQKLFPELKNEANRSILEHLQNGMFRKEQIVNGRTTYVVLIDENKSNNSPDYVFPIAQ